MIDYQFKNFFKKKQVKLQGLSYGSGMCFLFLVNYIGVLIDISVDYVIDGIFSHIYNDRQSIKIHKISPNYKDEILYLLLLL